MINVHIIVLWSELCIERMEWLRVEIRLKCTIQDISTKWKVAQTKIINTHLRANSYIFQDNICLFQIVYQVFYHNAKKSYYEMYDTEM